MKKISILVAALAAFTLGSIRAQTQAPLNHQQAIAALNTLTHATPPPPPAQVVAAWQVVLAAPDITPRQTSDGLHELGHSMLAAHAAPADVLAVFYQAAQLPGNTGGFLEYLTTALRFGDPYKGTAIGQVAAFVAANPGSQDAIRAQAMAANATGQLDQAVILWTNLANSYKTYTAARGDAILKAAQASQARGDSLKFTSGLVAPLLTAMNVPVADKSYQVAFDLVQRPVGKDNYFTTQAALIDFLTNVLNVVPRTETNKSFVGYVSNQQAQVMAAPATTGN